MLTELLLPGLPKKVGRPRLSNKSVTEQDRDKKRRKNAQRRAAGLRPVLVWLPLEVLETATEIARKASRPREEILVEKLSENFSPSTGVSQETITTNHSPQ